MKPSQSVNELFTNFYILPIVEKRWSATLEADQPIIKKLTNIRYLACTKLLFHAVLTLLKLLQ